MRKTTTETTDTISVEVGRFNEPTRGIDIAEGATIQEVIKVLDITLSDTETLWVDGEKAEANDIVENNDRIQIVGKKEGGNYEDITPEVEVPTEEVKDEEETPALTDEDAPVQE